MKWLVLVLLAGCAHGSPAAPPGNALALPANPAAPQPAGVYWVPYKTCNDCVEPVALVAYRVPEVGAARTITAALEPTLALGLPYVVHTDEIGAAPAIAVVIGGYPSLDAATAVARRSPVIAGHRADVIDLTSPVTVPDDPHFVTRIDRGPPAPAWSKADVDDIRQALDESTDPDAHATLASQHRWVQRKLAERPPLCTIAPGAMFVVTASELDYYELAPVRCGTTPAYVDWQRSLLGHAVIVPDRTGGYRLHQVVGAECDSPIIEDWRYDRDGRHRDPEPAERGRLVASRC